MYALAGKGNESTSTVANDNTTRTSAGRKNKCKCTGVQDPASPTLSPIQLETAHNHEIDVEDASDFSFAVGSISSIEESSEASSLAPSSQLQYVGHKSYAWGDRNFQDSMESTAPGSLAEHGYCDGDFSASLSALSPQNKSAAGKDGEKTSIPFRVWDVGTDGAINTTADSSFSMVNPNGNMPWAEGKRINGAITIHAFRAEVSQLLLDEGKSGIDACHIYAQTRLHGLFELYSRRQSDRESLIVDIFRMQKQDAALSAAAKAAFNGRPHSIEIPGGCKGEPSDERSPTKTVVEDADRVRRASNEYCIADGVFNVLKQHRPELVLIIHSEVGEDGSTIKFEDLGLFLRHLVCDHNGYSGMGAITDIVCGSNVFPFELVRVTDRTFPGVRQVKKEARGDRIIEESKNGHMFLVQCIRREDSTSTHYVGLANGIIYDNDSKTGGTIPAEKFCEDYMAGIRKAVEIVPRPASFGGKKKRKNGKKRKRADERTAVGAEK